MMSENKPTVKTEAYSLEFTTALSVETIVTNPENENRSQIDLFPISSGNLKELPLRTMNLRASQA